MKAISLSQPWCWAILYADKHIENRSWQPPIGMIDQQICLHAAKSWDVERRTIGDHYVTPFGYLLALGFDSAPNRKDLYPASAIVGLATIDRIVTVADTLPDDQKRWFFGPFGWVLRDVRRLPTPIPCRGFQGLWHVPDDVLDQVTEQAAA